MKIGIMIVLHHEVSLDKMAKHKNAVNVVALVNNGG